MSAPMTQLALICAAFFAGGFTSCALLVLMLRERIVARAVDRGERELYGPMLQHVERHEQANQARHAADAYQPSQPMAGGALGIRLDAFGARHRGEH